MNKKMEMGLAVGGAILVLLAVGQLIVGNWIESASLAVLAFAMGMQGITTRRLRRGYQQQIQGMAFKYGDLVMTEAGERGMVISDRPLTGWVSVVIFKSSGVEQAAVYSSFDLVKTS